MDEGQKIKLDKVIQLKNLFINRFNNDNKLKELTDVIQDIHYKTAISELAKTFNVQQINNYQEIKRIAIEVKQQNARDVFIYICNNNNLDDWIKDNGQYYKIVIDAYIKVFKSSPQAIAYFKS